MSLIRLRNPGAHLDHAPGFLTFIEMKEIKLSKGLKTRVDDCDFENLNQFKWRASKEFNTYYAVRVIKIGNRRHTIRMHIEIMGVFDCKLMIDHEDRDGLNNQRYNLRPATNQQNSRNQAGVNKSSKYKGVFFSKSKCKYSAQIKIDYKSKHIGYFINEEEAARAYDAKARELFGEFAYLNFG